MAIASIVIATLALIISLSRFGWEIWNRKAATKVYSKWPGAAKVRVGNGHASYLIWVVTLFNQSDVANLVLRSHLTVELNHEVSEYRLADLDFDSRGRMRCTPPSLDGETSEEANAFILSDGTTPSSGPLIFPLELPAHASKTGYVAYRVTPNLMDDDPVDCQLMFQCINGSPVSTNVNTQDAAWWPSDFYEEWTFLQPT